MPCPTPSPTGALTPPTRSGGGRRPAPLAEVDRGLPDGLKVALNPRIGVHILLDLCGDLIPGLAFETGEEVVHVGMKRQIVRRVERDARHHTRQFGGRARRWNRGRRLVGGRGGGGA